MLLYHVPGTFLMSVLLKSPRSVLKCVETMTLLSADAVAMRKDKFIKRYLLNSCVVCEICSLIHCQVGYLE